MVYPVQPNITYVEVFAISIRYYRTACVAGNVVIDRYFELVGSKYTLTFHWPKKFVITWRIAQEVTAHRLKATVIFRHTVKRILWKIETMSFLSSSLRFCDNISLNRTCRNMKETFQILMEFISWTKIPTKKRQLITRTYLRLGTCQGTFTLFWANFPRQTARHACDEWTSFNIFSFYLNSLLHFINHVSSN